MLQPAQLYTEELREMFSVITYDERFKFLYGVSFVDGYKPSDSTWGDHEFVSIRHGHIIGYFKYSISRETYNVSELIAVNFLLNADHIFACDLMRVLKDIFLKYRFNKISFRCVIGNPIEESYDKAIKKYGGNIVGIQRRHTKLMDGLVYDFKSYEILREDFLANYRNKSI